MAEADEFNVDYDIDDLIEPKNKKKNIFAKTWKESGGNNEGWQYEKMGDPYGPEGTLVGREYQKTRKGFEAHIEFMPPEKYYEISGRSPSTLSRERIDAVKQSVESGNKISLPWIEFEEGKHIAGRQEGHHRIWAAKELGAEKVPVVIANRDPKYIDKSWPPRSLEGKKKRNPFTFEEDYFVDVDW